MSNVTGLCYVRVNGPRLKSKEGATLTRGGRVAELVTAVTGVVGAATKELQAAEIKAKIVHTGDLDITAVQRWRNFTATFETDSGQRYLIRNASVVDAVELSGHEVDVTIGGQEAERV